jgi:hypothetical protein
MTDCYINGCPWWLVTDVGIAFLFGVIAGCLLIGTVAVVKLWLDR